MRRLLTMAAAAVALAACEITPVVTGPASAPAPAPVREAAQPRSGGGTGIADFRTVVRRVEPVAEAACRERLPRGNCDFAIVVDRDPRLPPNAAQTYRNGQPVIIFTETLLGQMRNRDELAFALAHEAAHHIEGHIDQTNASATTGALIGVLAGTVLGLDRQGVAQVRDIGGTVGARRFSKGFELEADALGARIAERAGYDAVRGVQYFARAADPGDRFLGSHPPNRDRIDTVRRVVGR